MVKVANKVRVAYIKSTITTFVARLLQEWVLNKFKDKVLMNITPHAAIVAVAEFSGDNHIMNNSQAQLTMFEELGADHAHDI